MLAFSLDDRETVLRVAYKASKYRRRQAHLLADAFGFRHVGSGRHEEVGAE
jgi:hypothetical protein